MKANPPSIQYCWMFNHPIAGWCGGTPDDMWTHQKSVVERNASFCEWETKVITRNREKYAMPGSVQPSIRRRLD